MLRLPETFNRGVDTACSCNRHWLYLFSLSVARVHSGFEIIARGSALGMGVHRLSRPPSGVGVLAMPDMGWDKTRGVEPVCEVPQGARGL